MEHNNIYTTDGYEDKYSQLSQNNNNSENNYANNDTNNTEFKIL